MVISLSFLGRVLVEDGAGPVAAILSRPRLLSLLACLATEAPTAFLATDRLRALLWPGTSDQRARRSLNQLLHTARKHLGADLIERRGTGLVRLNPARIRADVRLLLHGRPAPHELAGLCGDFMPGFRLSRSAEFERWLDDTRAEVRRRFVEASVEAARLAGNASDPRAAAGHARAALQADPLSQSGFLALIEALHLAGDAPAAWQAFQEYRERLSSDLDMPVPAHLTRRVVELCTDDAGRGGSLDSRPPEPPLTAGVGLPVSRTTNADGRAADPAARVGGYRSRWWLAAAAVAIAVGGHRVVSVSAPPVDQAGEEVARSAGRELVSDTPVRRQPIAPPANVRTAPDTARRAQ